MQPLMTESNDTPLVTVVIPTYNRMPYIIEAIDSVIAQTYTNWELFVVDDGSTDNTVTAVKAKAHNKVHMIELPHRGLIGPLRNEGAQRGKGEWICFLDSDDLWIPQKLEMQIAAVQKAGMECCYTNFELMDEKRNTIPLKDGKFEAFSGNIIDKVLTTEAAISIGSLMVNRNLFNKLGGFNNNAALMYRDDYELTLRLALQTELLALPTVLLRIREYKGRGTNLMAEAEAHLRSSIPYEIFIAAKPVKKLRKIAKKQYRQHMVRVIKLNLKLGNYWLALKQIKKTAMVYINITSRKLAGHSSVPVN